MGTVIREMGLKDSERFSAKQGEALFILEVRQCWHDHE
jgi:hypothetical protein